MKKFLLSLLAFFALHASAVIDETVVFEFSSPSMLNITPPFTDYELANMSGYGDIVSLTDKTIIEGKASLSLSYGTGKVGVSIYYESYIDDEGNTVDSYSLSMGSYAQMTIEVPSDCELSSIVFVGSIGNLRKDPESPGILNTVTRAWTSNGETGITKVSFSNGPSNDTHITQIKVSYTRPPVPLNLLSTSPADKDTVSVFNSMSLRFDLPVQLSSSPAITFSGAAISGTHAMTPSIASSVVTLTPEVPVTVNGPYTVNVPAGTFHNAEGSPSPAINRTFYLHVPLVADSILPNEGTYTTIPNKVSLYFPVNVKVDLNKIGDLIQDDIVVGFTSVSVDPENPKKVILHLSNLTGDLTRESVWIVKVPAKAIHSVWFNTRDELDTWNDPLELYYTVEKANSKTMKAATELLANVGVGFPAEGSVGRDSLSRAIADDATSEELLAAMDAFYNETEVTMPEDGTWYKIAGVNNSAETDALKHAYLAYTKDSVVTLTTDAEAAASFRAIVEDNKVALMTADGRRYLHVLTNSNDYTSTTPKNVTPSLRVVNWLTFEKLAPEGCDSTLTLGRMTMSGLLGRDIKTETTEATSIAAINYTGLTIVDSPTDTVYFDDVLSSAFLFIETVAPDTISPAVVISPQIIEHAGDSLLLTVMNVDKTSIADGSKPYFTKDGKRVDFSETILSNSDKVNVFLVNTKNLVVGQYILMMPAGTFAYVKKDKTVRDVPMSVAFEVKGGGTNPDYDPGYNYAYSTISWLEFNQRYENRISYISDTDLNDFVLFSQVNSPFSGLVPDTTKQVRLYYYYADKTIRMGHFVPYPEIEDVLGETGFQAIKLVLDEPVHEGELDNQKGTYAYSIPKGTYGDLNFARYLEDPTSVAPTECISNIQSVWTVSVDNFRASVHGDGSLENPYNASAAQTMMSDRDKIYEKFYFRGIISNILSTFYEYKGRASFSISDDGTNRHEYQFSDVYYLNNQRWKEGDMQIQEGDDVIIYGSLKAPEDDIYREKAENHLYLFSLNDNTSGIRNINVNAKDEQFYDLQGRKVSAPTTPGVYIMNGKKRVVK